MEKVYTDSCNTLCTCSQGTLTCVSNTCGKDEICYKNSDDVLACYPSGVYDLLLLPITKFYIFICLFIAGHATCNIFGDSHYFQFDDVDRQNRKTFRGGCSYYAAHTSTLNKYSDERYFAIETTNVIDGSISRIETINVMLGNGISIKVNDDMTVKVI